MQRNLREILEKLLKTLDETYERVLKEINEDGREHQGEHARRLLHCLVVALRPLCAEELAGILAFDFGRARGDIPKIAMIRRLDAGQSIRVQHVLKIGLDRGRSYIRHGDNKAGTRGCRVRSGAVRPTGANKRSGSKKVVVLDGEVEGRAHSNAVSECASERVVQNSA